MLTDADPVAGTPIRPEFTYNTNHLIKVYAKVQTDSQIQIYPVPANEQVTIQHLKTSGKTTISLISPDGKIVQQVVAVPGTFQTQVNIGNLQNGLYFVRYDDGQGNIQTSSVIKN